MQPIGAYKIALVIHYISSGSFMLIALFLIFRNIRGIINKLPYLKTDKVLAYLFIINLYVQLFLGIILFTNLSVFGYEYHASSGGVVEASKRLWPVEHIVLMLFALFIANLGLILSNKSSKAATKHRQILIYYLIAIFLIGISLASIYWF
jgi:hypothetical protein